MILHNQYTDQNMLIVMGGQNEAVVIESVGESFCFSEESVIYVHVSELGLPKSVRKYNLNTGQIEDILAIPVGEHAKIISVDELYSYIAIENKSYDLKG